ncbi:hypothetical protein PROFUN_06550 [Planoprotostelium fungivorum]|uniref:F5/8 type C domain-containing protein n=1 Tax=Planoprotostelium fungivorum TaxID=1890364 RepID=A0A2P6MRT9_9EUKA|nr:hypothetical protein PROFUN_06550 [Planoprotostelium fungivorum]
MVDFGKKVTIEKILITFQGGFVATEVLFKSSVDGGDFEQISEFHPSDDNSCQTFSLSEPVQAEKVQLVFPKSTDFYGRITIYRLDILGSQ